MRKRMGAIAGAVLLVLAVQQGCSQNAVTVTVKTVGAAERSIDLAMTTWGQFVRDGKATPDLESQVRGGYENYQKALANAILVLHVTKGTETPAELAKAATDLLMLISKLTGKPFNVGLNELLEVVHAS